MSCGFLTYQSFGLVQKNAAAVVPEECVGCLESEVSHFNDRAKVGADDAFFDVKIIFRGRSRRNGALGVDLVQLWWRWSIAWG